MANYQNNMRYSRMGNVYQAQRLNYTSAKETACCMQPQQRDNNCSQETENRERVSCEESLNRERTCCEEAANRERTCCKEMTGRESMCQNDTEKESKKHLAMAYIPWQTWQNIYETCRGFHRGTIFAELDKPFLGRGGCNR